MCCSYVNSVGNSFFSDLLVDLDEKVLGGTVEPSVRI